MDEPQKLREQAEHYRRMMQSTDDKKACEVLETLAREHEQKAQEVTDRLVPSQSEQ